MNTVKIDGKFAVKKVILKTEVLPCIPKGFAVLDTAVDDFAKFYLPNNLLFKGKSNIPIYDHRVGVIEFGKKMIGYKNSHNWREYKKWNKATQDAFCDPACLEIVEKTKSDGDSQLYFNLYNTYITPNKMLITLRFYSELETSYVAPEFFKTEMTMWHWLCPTGIKTRDNEKFLRPFMCIVDSGVDKKELYRFSRRERKEQIKEIKGLAPS